MNRKAGLDRGGSINEKGCEMNEAYQRAQQGYSKKILRGKKSEE